LKDKRLCRERDGRIGYYVWERDGRIGDYVWERDGRIGD